MAQLLKRERSRSKSPPPKENIQANKKDTKAEETKKASISDISKPITRAGGVYIPPHRMKQLQEENGGDSKSVQYQRFMWEALRKSINGIINKVNVANIQNIIIELFNENLMRGKGLFIKAVMRNQMASPNFTHVYAALMAVVNTKLPEHGKLLISRVLHQFKTSFKRNNKIVCIATTKMLAHLVNQQIVHEIMALELLALLLEKPTEDSVEIATDFMVECGQVLSEISPAGVNAIFERFRGILHEGSIEKRVQYEIENLFAIRKIKFADHIGVIPELDLVEEDDRITHETTLESENDLQEGLNYFQYDDKYEVHEQEWDKIKKEILGEELEKLNKLEETKEEEKQEEEEKEGENIYDFTEQDLMNLRRTIYLIIMSSVDFEECCHKLLRLNIREGQEMELVYMILECCMQERTYLKFFGLLAERFCLLKEELKKAFENCFAKHYETIHRLETNKLRNLAKLFAHLLFTNAIDWGVLKCINLTQEDTTSSGRIFIKILFQEIAEHFGLEKLKVRMDEEDALEALVGIFPKQNLKNTRFAINFFTAIGLGAITESMREFLKNAPKLLAGTMETKDDE